MKIQLTHYKAKKDALLKQGIRVKPIRDAGDTNIYSGKVGEPTQNVYL